MKKKSLLSFVLVCMMILSAGCTSQSQETSLLPEADVSSVSEPSEESSSTDESTEEVSSSSESTGEVSSMQGETGILEEDLTLYECTTDGDHAIEAEGTEETYEFILVEKTGDVDGEEADFYGENAAVFAADGAFLTINNAVIRSAGTHANGVFSYGSGTTITISNSTIETTKNNSGGLMITGGGTIYATDLYVTTQGGSSAAIRSDRGGGTGYISGGYYETNGKGSPTIYSTADITVTDATLVANTSEAVVVEGKNSVTLVNCVVSGNHTQKNSNKSDAYQAVKIYQSMSGDAAEGTASFTMEGGSLTSLNGGMFWVSNTSAVIRLTNVSFTYADDDFLTVEAAGWGKSGANGGHVTLITEDQIMEGRITVDDISSLDMELGEGTVYTGSINTNGASGEVEVTIEEGAVWELTGDSYVNELDCDGTIILNGYSLYVDGVLYIE